MIRFMTCSYYKSSFEYTVHVFYTSTVFNNVNTGPSCPPAPTIEHAHALSFWRQFGVTNYFVCDEGYTFLGGIDTYPIICSINGERIDKLCTIYQQWRRVNFLFGGLNI